MFETTSFKPKAIAGKEKFYTIEEYLEMEEHSLVNHEYDNGKIIPMAGGSPPHSKIKGQAITAFNIAIWAAGKSYDVYNSDIRIYLPSLGKSVMPDGAVVVGKPEFTIETPVGLLINPTLVLEVFSKSSESYDRGEKFNKYKTLPSFREYLLVSQVKPLVKVFVKKGGQWVENQTAEGLEASIHLESLGVDVPLATIYRGVDFAKNQALQ